MRSFIRLVMFRRYNNNNNNGSSNNGNSKTIKHQSTRRSNNKKTIINNDDNNNNNNTTSILTLMAIQSTNYSQYHNHNTGSYGNNSNGNGLLSLMVNEYYNKSWNGTLGPSTESYQRMSWKGERTLSRSRLEVCPAITTSLVASCKPIGLSWQFAKNLRPLYLISVNILKQMEYYII
jgi:hypothetical protein